MLGTEIFFDIFKIIWFLQPVIGYQLLFTNILVIALSHATLPSVVTPFSKLMMMCLTCTTLYNVCSVRRGMFSTSGGYHDYIGGGGCSVQQGDIISTLGDVQYIGVFNRN